MDTVTSVEMIVRWLGGAGILALTAIVMFSIIGSRSRQRSTTTGSLRIYRNLPFLIVLAAVYVFLCIILWRPILVSPSSFIRIAMLIVGSVLYAGGCALTLWGRATLGEMHNVSSTFGAVLFAGHRLIMWGPFAFVRHPMYVGAILMGIGGLLIYQTWTLVLIAAHLPIFAFRARREEQALAAQFGAEWTEYCRRVPGWIPRLSRAQAPYPGETKPA